MLRSKLPSSLPSVSARCMRRALQRSPTYPATLKEHAGYSEASIRNCVQVRLFIYSSVKDQ